MNRAAKISAVTRIGCLWDATLVTDDGFGARMCKKCVQSHRFGLGSEWGGGGGSGGSANREPGSYIPVCVCVCVCGWVSVSVRDAFSISTIYPYAREPGAHNTV